MYMELSSLWQMKSFPLNQALNMPTTTPCNISRSIVYLLESFHLYETVRTIYGKLNLPISSVPIIIPRMAMDHACNIIKCHILYSIHSMSTSQMQNPITRSSHLSYSRHPCHWNQCTIGLIQNMNLSFGTKHYNS